MSKKLFKAGVLVFILALISACQTTSTTRTKSLGAGTSTTRTSGFDRAKAAQVRLSAGLQYLQQGSLQNAKRHLDKALELGDESGNVYFGMGYYYEKVKEFDRAEAYYDLALDLEPNNPDFLNGYASFKCSKGKYKEADKIFNKAFDQPIYPAISEAYVNAGVCAKRAKNIEKAGYYFRKALDRNNKIPVALIEMAEVEFEKKRYQRANSYIKRFEKVAYLTANSLWLSLRVSHFLADKNALASYTLKLEQMFPDSDQTAEYLDSADQWK